MEGMKMNIWGLLKNILPFVTPYRWLIVITLVLTLIGSLMAQVNAVVLDRAVDAINALLQQPEGFLWSQAVKILTVITVILLGKEVIGALVTFFQRYYGERMRILVSRDMSLKVVDRILSFRMAFFTSEGNETGKLQSRIDRGIMSMSNTVNNFFIEILPLFTILLGDLYPGHEDERWTKRHFRWTSGRESGYSEHHREHYRDQVV